MEEVLYDAESSLADAYLQAKLAFGLHRYSLIGERFHVGKYPRPDGSWSDDDAVWVLKGPFFNEDDALFFFLDYSSLGGRTRDYGTILKPRDGHHFVSFVATDPSNPRLPVRLFDWQWLCRGVWCSEDCGMIVACRYGWGCKPKADSRVLACFGDDLAGAVDWMEDSYIPMHIGYPKSYVKRINESSWHDGSVYPPRKKKKVASDFSAIIAENPLADSE